MPRPAPPEPPLRDIRFTRRIARQCLAAGPGVTDRVVCDAIANGSRTATARLGAGGGRVLRFERSYGALGTVAVLGELTRRGCLALRLVLPGGGRKKSGKDRDF